MQAPKTAAAPAAKAAPAAAKPAAAKPAAAKAGDKPAASGSKKPAAPAGKAAAAKPAAAPKASTKAGQGKVGKGKKVAPLPAGLKSKAAPEAKKKKIVNPLIEKTPKNFSIGGTVQPKRDLGRFVRWPKYVRIQRQRAILKKRLKVPPSVHQFGRTLAKNAGKTFAPPPPFLFETWCAHPLVFFSCFLFFFLFLSCSSSALQAYEQVPP